LAALGANAGLLTLAAQASSSSATMTMKWNNTYSISAAFQGNYSSTGSSGTLSPAGSSFIPIKNGGAGSCNGGGGTTGITAGGAGTTALTMDFGNVTPDTTNTTICVLLNAVEVAVNTTDPAGATVLVQMTASPVALESLCYVPISNYAPVAIGSGVASGNLTAAKAQDTTDTTSSFWTDPTKVCNGLTYNGAAVAGATAFSTTQTNFLKSTDSTTNPAYFGADYALVIPAAAAGVNDSATITYTITTN
jgi:hypothetical protein